MTDPFFPVGNGEALARDIPGARLLVLERAATAIPDVAAGEVAAAMLELPSERVVGYADLGRNAKAKQESAGAAGRRFPIVRS